MHKNAKQIMNKVSFRIITLKLEWNYVHRKDTVLSDSNKWAKRTLKSLDTYEKSFQNMISALWVFGLFEKAARRPLSITPASVFDSKTKLSIGKVAACLPFEHS